MVSKIHIKNFKSVYDLEIELGRINIFIGENGCGKTNILEAVALGGAASANLLSNEFLATRGIRVTEPGLMFSAFNNKSSGDFGLDFESNQKNYSYKVHFGKEEGGFVEINREKILKKTRVELLSLFGKDEFNLRKAENPENTDLLRGFREAIDKLPSPRREVVLSGIEDFAVNIELAENFVSDLLVAYLIFSPENNSLRNFFDERQILPLGLKGEGLFKELKRISLKKSKRQFTEINKHLEELLDWFEKFELSANGFPGEQYLKIRDKYLSESVDFMDQRSANEGFLFLLFYLTLFISEQTPVFFAIDNIENSFNPKLCRKLAEVLTVLAKKHEKQALITTHNPFVLDGLDLSDDDQRLFVVRRNLDGHTIANRIKPEKPLSFNLSEAWMNGYIGGLPNNF